MSLERELLVVDDSVGESVVEVVTGEASWGM